MRSISRVYAPPGSNSALDEAFAPLLPTTLPQKKRGERRVGYETLSKSRQKCTSNGSLTSIPAVRVSARFAALRNERTCQKRTAVSGKFDDGSRHILWRTAPRSIPSMTSPLYSVAPLSTRTVRPNIMGRSIRQLPSGSSKAAWHRSSGYEPTTTPVCAHADKAAIRAADPRLITIRASKCDNDEAIVPDPAARCRPRVAEHG